MEKRQILSGQCTGAGFFFHIAINIPPANLDQPFYEGSVQRLYEVPDDPSFMITQTTERGSVFDVGALFEIPGHDVNRAVFRHVLYSRMGDTAIWDDVRQAISDDSRLDEPFRKQLLEGCLEEFCSMGALTHHVGMLDAQTGEMVAGALPDNPSAYNIVRKFKILKPNRTDLPDGASLFDYSGYTKQDGFVVPLEFIVRFGITSASSVYKKYQAMTAEAQQRFEKELGVSEPLQAWQYLDRPITDFTTKFEPVDRMLSRQEALITSSLSGRLFTRSIKMSILGAWAVRQLVEALGLKMWDIKWEFALEGQDLVYVDTIDTDSIRATLDLEYRGKTYINHFNKQAMRDYFTLLHQDWIEAINDAKSRGENEGRDFTEILAEGQEKGVYAQTPEVKRRFIEVQEQKMNAISQYMLGKADAETSSRQLHQVGLEEIAFYDEVGCLEALHAINGI